MFVPGKVGRTPRPRGTHVDDSFIPDRAHIPGDVVDRVVVRKDELPVLVVLATNRLDGGLQVLEPVTGGEEKRDLQKRALS